MAKKNNTAAVVIGIVAALILIVAGLLVWYINKPVPVPTAIDIDGQTLGDMAESNGMEVSDIIYMYHLPENLTAETSIAEAQNLMPLRHVAVMNNMSVQTFKEQRKIPDEITGEGNILDSVLKIFGINRYKITGETPYVLAEGEITLADYVGENNMEAFKSEYGFGDEVTLDTKWKEVRDTILNKQKEEYAAQQEAMNAAAAQSDAESAEAVETETTETEVAETETTETETAE